MKRKSKLNSAIYSSLIFLGSLTTYPTALYAQVPGIEQTNPDFRHLAKNTIPAVVYIKVESTSKKTNGFHNSLPFDDQYDEFWQRFFGFPKGDDSPQTVAGQASGVIVSPDGYVLTNSHVVNGFDKILVQLVDGREFSAKVVGEDENSDLAVLKIDGEKLPYLKLGDSDKVEVGEWVAAIGNPFGLQATFTKGIISGKGRNNLDITKFGDFLQTDAAINRGNSGGPLVNMEGKVVGINTAIATNNSGGFLGVGFAIPSNLAKYVMDQLISSGTVTRSFLGVGLQELDANLAKAFGIPKKEGVLITEIVKGSPAEKAGLKTGDIITKYNNKSFEGIGALRNIIALSPPGSRFLLTVWRENKQIDIPITVELYSEEPNQSNTVENSLGFEVGNITPEIANGLGLSETKGVVITKVLSNGVSAMAGLKKGSVILEVNKQPIENIDQFNQIMKERDKSKPVLLLIKQGKATLYISLLVE